MTDNSAQFGDEIERGVCAECGKSLQKRWRYNNDDDRCCLECGEGPVFPIAARDDLGGGKGDGRLPGVILDPRLWFFVSLLSLYLTVIN